MASASSFSDLKNITNHCTQCTASNTNETTNELYISTTMRIGISVYYCFIIIASVTCNTALIAIITTCKRLHTISHLFIVNLAISNLFTSLLYLPFDVETHLKGGFFPHGKFLCGVYQLTFMVSLPLSTINLLLLTLESFITIAYPYKRARLVNRRNVTITVLLAHFYAFTCTLFPVLRHQQHSIVLDEEIGLCYVKFSRMYIYFFVMINLFLPMAIIIVLNLIIFNIANYHTKQIRSLQTVAGDVDKALYTSTQCTGAEYIEKIQPSDVLLRDNIPTLDGNTERRINFNSDTFLNIIPSCKTNTMSSDSDSTSKTLVNSSQQRSQSFLSKISSRIVQNKQYSFDSYNSCMTSIDPSPIDINAVASSLIPINKQRRNRQFPKFGCNIRAAKRIALLVGECIFCWFVYIIIVFINISVKWNHPNWNPFPTQIGMMISCSTLFLNPLIYGLLNPKVRTVVIDRSISLIPGCRWNKRSSASY